MCAKLLRMSSAVTTSVPETQAAGPKPLDGPLPDPAFIRNYAPDMLSRGRTVAAVAAAALGGGLFTLVAWAVLKQTTLPAFNTSLVTRALATAGTVAVLVAVGVLTALWLLDEHRSPHSPVSRPRWRVALTYAMSYLAPAGIVVPTLAIPLAATRLYLDGLQVDQSFRTQFLTRMAETASNQDMNYIDMVSYYPIAWFWMGGRLANILGLSGWEVYQPWAIISLAIAGCILVPVWQRITGSLPVATGIALVTTCITLVMSPEEPYAAVIAMGVPAVCAILRRALMGSWYATAGTIVYLGVAASFYTLFTGAVALSVVAVAAIFTALVTRWWVPIIRLVVIGLGSIAIALVSWGPFLWQAITGPEVLESTANHFLPQEGTQIPVPFLAPSVVGILCMLGLIYFIMRFTDMDIRVMAVMTIGFYLWSLASMVATLAGTSLLGFRIDILIVLMMSTAGVLALAELRLIGVRHLYPESLTPETGRMVTIVLLVLVLAAGGFYAQAIPARNANAIEHAYQDTDGFGERADRFAPDVASYYPDIDKHLRAEGFQPTDTVVFTDENRFLSFHPYHGFNAFTSHYANPLGEYSQRSAAVRSWAENSWKEDATPESFLAEIRSVPWHAPEVFIFRGEADGSSEGWKTHLAEDIYPNNPNVRHSATFFNPEVFADEALWHVEQIGPFVVVSAHNE